MMGILCMKRSCPQAVECWCFSGTLTKRQPEVHKYFVHKYTFQMIEKNQVLSYIVLTSLASTIVGKLEHTKND